MISKVGDPLSRLFGHRPEIIQADFPVNEPEEQGVNAGQDARSP